MSHLFITPKSTNYFTLDLSTRLGRGATASVYKVTINGKSYAVKIYNKPDQVDWAKISAMTELGERDEYQFALTHAWPVGLIQKDGQNVGFAMPLYDLGLFTTLDHYYDNLLRGQIKDTQLLALPNLVLIAKNLCIELEKLHKKSIYLVDIKPQDVVVNTTTNEVVLLDCDGFSVEKDGVRYPASLISADYIAPEVTINKLSPKTLGLGQDLYGISVLIFQILNRGLHPFSGKLKKEISATTNDDKAALGYYAYGADENPIIAPHVSSLHTMWPKSITTQLENCFTSGERASASDWISTFNEIERNKGYVRCDKFQKDHLHIRFRDQECMQCKIDNLQQTHAPSKPPVQSSEPIGKPYIPPSPPPSKSGSNTWIFLVIIGFVAFIIFAGERDNNQTSIDVTTNNSSNTCSSTRLGSCSNERLCSLATSEKADRTKVWDNAPALAKFVTEAKRRNLTCGINQSRRASAVCNPPTKIQACSKEFICGAATYQGQWLSSSSIYVREAKRRNLTCNVKTTRTTNQSTSCSSTNMRACSTNAVCAGATIGYPKRWKTTNASKPWVKEAKRRNLSCNVEISYGSTQSTGCSSTNPRVCSVATVCNGATIGNTKKWKTTDAISRRWVEEAKRRNLSCGVNSNDAPKLQRYNNYSIIGNDLLAEGIWDVSERQCVQRCLTFYNKRCRAISYIAKQRSCWLKPSPKNIQKLNGVNTITIDH